MLYPQQIARSINLPAIELFIDFRSRKHLHEFAAVIERDFLGRNVALVDGSSICTVKHPIIYNLINTQTVGTHEIEIVASSDNTIIYTFVFG